MQYLLLIFLCAISAAGCVWLSGSLIVPVRGRKERIGLFIFALLACAAGTVIFEGVYKAGRPTFYYHTHAPGRATLKFFAGGCFLSALFLVAGFFFLENKLLKKVARRGIRAFLIKTTLFCLLGASLAELFLFNMRHYELIGAEKPRVVLDRNDIYAQGFFFNRASQLFTSWQMPESSLYLVNIYTKYTKIRNMRFDFDDGSPQTRMKLYMSDEAFEIPYFIGEFTFRKDIPRSYNIPIHTVGTTYAAQMVLPDVDHAKIETFALPFITLNQPIALDLQPGRFSLTFGFFLLIGCFRPNSALYRSPIRPRSRAQRSAVILFLLGCFGWFAWSAFSSYADSALSISEQKSQETRNHLQYNRLVSALMARRYALIEQPDKDLINLGRPYDMGIRERYRAPYLWDTAFYKNQYYVYFGVVPALLVLLPYKLLSGQFLELDYAILFFCCAGAGGLSGLYLFIMRRWFKEISFGHLLAGLIMLISMLNLTWCLRRGLVYELAICSGFCFAAWGIFFLVVSCERAGKSAFLMSGLSGASLGLAIGCRPPLALLAIPAGMSLISSFRNSGKFFSSRHFLRALAFALPYALIVAALMKYNFERFGNPFEFGITYQLTSANETLGLFRTGIWGTLISFLSYFFTPPLIDSVFPFIHPNSVIPPYNGFLMSDNLIGLFSFPVMFFLLGLSHFKKEIKKRGPFLWTMTGGLLIGGVSLCLVSSLFSVTFRYQVDFAWLFGLPAIICLMSGVAALEKRQMTRWINAILMGCLICGVLIFLSVSVIGEQDWFRLINPSAFEKLRYAYEFWR